MDDYSMWIVRYTNAVLIAWFLTVAIVLGFWIVKPAFEHYVDRLIEVRQLALERNRVEQLFNDQKRLVKQLETYEGSIRSLHPLMLAEKLKQVGDVQMVTTSSDRWVFQLNISPKLNPLSVYDILMHVSGVIVETIEVQSSDEGLLLRLSIRPEKQPYWHVDDNLDVTSDVSIPPVGGIENCPSLLFRARLGDQVLINWDASETRLLSIGEWLTRDWRFLAYRNNQFILKNAVGRTCVQKNG
jgi:hypothetical protein